MRWRLQTLGRALVRRCLRCGGAGIFTGYFALVDHCPTCGLAVEREDGYWVGAMIVNLALTLAAFVVLCVGGLLLFWPDVPWTGLTVVSVVVIAGLPVLAYPWSKTLWWWIDIALITPPGLDWAGWARDTTPPAA